MDKITDAMTSLSLVDINTITDNNTADDMKELCSTIDSNLLHFANLKLERLTEVFNKKLVDLYQSFNKQLNEIKAASIPKTTDLENSLDKSDIFQRLKAVEELTPKISEVESSVTSSSNIITNLQSDIHAVSSRLSNLQVNTDEQVARVLEDESKLTSINARLFTIENRLKEIDDRQDDQEQQGRKGNVEFHRLLFERHRGKNEDTTGMIIRFCGKYLNIHLNRYDISVSHRQEHPADKKKEGRYYIPPIYCQFVNRSVARLVVERKGMLKYAKNSRGENYMVKENLTLRKRLLNERVLKELHTFKYKWVKNGSIFVRKLEGSHAIKVKSEDVLDDLLARQRAKVASSQNNLQESEPPAKNSQTWSRTLPRKSNAENELSPGQNNRRILRNLSSSQPIIRNMTYSPAMHFEPDSSVVSYRNSTYSTHLTHSQKSV